MQNVKNHNKTNRTKKTIYQLIQDLKNHVYLLDQSIEKHQEHPAHFITIGGELRVLVTKGSDHQDLLVYLARQFSVKLEVKLQISGEKISFNKYLQNKDVVLHGESYSNQAFIKLMCNKSGNFLHVQETTDEHVIPGNNTNLFDINANNRQLLAIANTTSSVAHSLLRYIEQLSKDALEILNKKFLYK